ncbi:MAG: hypothetical protein ACYS1C_12830 [Planctomycetota bacterium]
MADEIRPSRIFMPRRVKRTSREDREENEERFRKKLAELSAEDQPEDRSGNAPAVPQPQGQADHDAEPEAPAGGPGVGRNLDLRT